MVIQEVRGEMGKRIDSRELVAQYIKLRHPRASVAVAVQLDIAWGAITMRTYEED